MLFSDGFDRWTVKNLSQSASVQLLDELAPAIGYDQLITIVELVEGCPLALKVIGQLLHIYGAELTHKLKQELITVLDKASIHRERFRGIMDVAFTQLGALKDCGYLLSLFPGSFDMSAGIAIINSSPKECLELYVKHSLLDEQFLAYQYRYKMHRLIREYLKEKLSTLIVHCLRKDLEDILNNY